MTVWNSGLTNFINHPQEKKTCKLHPPPKKKEKKTEKKTKTHTPKKL